MTSEGGGVAESDHTSRLELCEKRAQNLMFSVHILSSNGKRRLVYVTYALSTEGRHNQKKSKNGARLPHVSTVTLQKTNVTRCAYEH